MRESRIKQVDERNRKARNFLIAFYFLYTYIEPYFINTIGSIGKYFTFIIIIGLVVFSRRFFFKGYHLAVLGWVLYKFFSLLWTTDYAIFELHYLTHIGTIALLILITAVDDSEACYAATVKSLWAGSVIVGILSLFFSRPYEGEANRQALALFGFQNDPNNQAAFLVFGLAISLYYLLYEKKHRWLHVTVIGINSYATLLTASRGGLLSLAIIIVGYIVTLYDKQTIRTNFKRIFLIAILVLLACVLIFSFLPKDISERLFDFDSYEGGSNRSFMWKHGLSILSSPANLIIGAGWGAYKTGGFSSLHNTFLSMLCDVGLIGFLMLFGPIVKAILSMLKKKNILPFTIFIAGMAPAFFFESINKRAFWNAIIFVFIAYNYYIANEHSKKEKTSELNKNRQIAAQSNKEGVKS